MLRAFFSDIKLKYRKVIYTKHVLDFLSKPCLEWPSKNNVIANYNPVGRFGLMAILIKKKTLNYDLVLNID